MYEGPISFCWCIRKILELEVKNSLKCARWHVTLKTSLIAFFFLSKLTYVERLIMRNNIKVSIHNNWNYLSISYKVKVSVTIIGLTTSSHSMLRFTLISFYKMSLEYSVCSQVLSCPLSTFEIYEIAVDLATDSHRLVKNFM